MERDPTQLTPAALTAANQQAGRLTAFTCPECNGTLWEVQEGGLVKLRCRVGHAYTEESYSREKALTLEAALWTALTALVERADFLRRLADRYQRSGRELSAMRYEEQAAGLLEHAEALRGALMAVEPTEADQQQVS